MITKELKEKIEIGSTANNLVKYDIDKQKHRNIVKTKVLLAGSMNPRNKGDQARLKATMMAVAESDDVSLGLLSHWYEEDRAVYAGDQVEIVKAPWAGEGIKLTRMALITVFSLVYYSVLSIARHVLGVRIKNKLLDYDSLVIASGIDFSDYAGRLPLYFSFYLVTLFSIIMRKPVMCYAQSIGPIENRLVRRLTRFFLNRMKTISVRDETSMVFLKDLKVNKPSLYATVDPAFLLKPDLEKTNDIFGKYGILQTHRPLIGVSLSPSPFAGPSNGYISMGVWYKVDKHKAQQLYNEYVQKMAHLCDRIINLFGATVLFIPSCTAKGDDDRECMNQVHKLMFFRERAICVNGDYSLADSMGIMGSCEMYISTRLHAAVLAAIMGVPLIPLVGTAGPRVPGIMKMLGLDKYIRNIMTTDEDRLMLTIRQIWSIREPQKKMIRSRILDLHEKAAENTNILHKFCSLNDNHHGSQA
jgi:colanic acid/amylovoran biosynthesis protein